MSVWDDERAPASLWDDPDDWEIPAGIPRHKGNDRPQIRRADDPTKLDYLQRPSKLGKGLDQQFLLDRAEKEKITWAMGRHEHLQMRAQAVLGPGGDGDPRFAAYRGGDEAAKRQIDADRAELRLIFAEAYKLAGGDSAATKGTALHQVFHLDNLGQPLDLPSTSPLLPALTELKRLLRGWRVHASELFVVWDCATCSEAAGRTVTHTAGSLDAVVSPLGIYRFVDTFTGEQVELTPDDRVVIDLKSGRWDVRGVTYLCQMACYGLATPYVHVSDAHAAGGDDGRREWPDGIEPRRDYVMIPHVPVGSPQDSAIVWVNLNRAGMWAHEAMIVTEAPRRVGEAFSPGGEEMLEARYDADGWVAASEVTAWIEQAACVKHGPHGGTADCPDCLYGETPTLHQVMTVNGLLELVERAPDEQAIRALHLEHAPLWTPYVAAKARARMSDLGLEVPAS